MAVNETTSVDVQTLRPFKRFIMTIGLLPTSYLESMTYAELVMWFCNFLQEQVIPTVNNNAEAVIELQNWFNNLDVQDEIDHKLDEMVEDGTLQEIIADYLNSKAVFGFDSVTDMKSATNLIDGSYAQTLGYYTKNDGGASLYKIREKTVDDTIDECSIIEMSNDLIAEIIITNGEINVKQFGAKGNNVFDNSDIFSKAINYASNNNLNVLIPEGIYIVNNNVVLHELSNITINCYGDIHAPSKTSPIKRVFTLEYCNNITINGMFIYSERNQEEQPPADHTRITEYGSNQAGFVLLGSTNIHFNNVKFDKLSYDFLFGKNTEDADTVVSDNIYIDGYYSTDGSQNIVVSYTDNLYINNAYIEPAEDLGMGDHNIYISAYTKNVTLNNSILTTKDGYLGTSINLVDSATNIAEASLNNFYMNNCKVKCTSGISAKNATNVYVNNCDFDSIELIEQPTWQTMFSHSGTGDVVVHDTKFNCYRTIITASTSNITKYKMYNCEIIANNYYFIYGTGKFDAEFESCKFIQNSTNGFDYLTGTDLSLLVNNCLHIVNGAVGFYISHRVSSATNSFIFKDNIVKFLNSTPNFIYNGSTYDSTGMKMLNNFLYGANGLGSSTNITNLININNYNNDVIIT